MNDYQSYIFFCLGNFRKDIYSSVIRRFALLAKSLAKIVY